MLDAETLKNHLIQEEKIAHVQWAEAEDYAAKRGISLEEALVSMEIINYSELGNLLSSIHLLPYKPLLSSSPSEEAWGLISLQCACKWKVFPEDYDPDAHVLTLVAHNPEQMQKIENINRFLMQPHSLAFTIASQSEINKAFEKYFGITITKISKSDQPPKGEDDVPGPTIKPAEPEKEKPQEAMKKLLALRQRVQARKQDGLGEKKDTAGHAVKHERSHKRVESEPSREELRKSLVSSVALLVSAHLDDVPDELVAIRARVRYCQMLASRLGMLQSEVDNIILAAWLSGLEHKPQIVKQFIKPESLEEVLLPGEHPCTGNLVLNLVNSYQDLKKRDPAACQDVNLTRRNLRLFWSESPRKQDMLETFLQLLMDEEFLANLDQAAGRILIVDPAESSTSSLSSPLTDDGYEVHVVSTAEAAEDIIAQDVPDLIIAAIDSPQADGLKFCQKVKRRTATADVPFLVLMDQDMEKNAVECLRAGADDFLVKPVDLELLFLKIQKLITSIRSETSRSGVSGALEEMSFTDMIQILCVGNKSLEIVLSREDQDGHVFVKDGEIVHACIGDLQGESAFYHLMQWQEGDFTTKQCSEFPDRTIQGSATSLLMEGARLADESGEKEQPA